MYLFCRKGSSSASALLAVCVLFTAVGVRAQSSDGGEYKIRLDQPQQVIKGLGFEIQSDSIGSLNLGMPEEVIAVPHDLTGPERTRLYKEMLHGFRYTRLAMGLYLRGLDADQKHIEERYPGQLEDLRTMQQVSGIEGFDVEYWSPPPFWKDSKSYYGGTLAGHDPAFFNAFSDALVQDVRYLTSHGLHVAQWGLQNEPVFGMTPLNGEKVKAGERPKMPYGIMFYSPEDYATTLKYTVPKLRALMPGLHIHANSWDGPAGTYAAEIRKDPELLKNIDAWTWHQVGSNSNAQIDDQAKYMAGAGGKPVYSNEFEYQPADLKKIDSPFMNTGQSLMNWMVFENSPTWYWLHALKPVTNLEATGYALGFWRPAGILKNNLRPALPEGHWEFNPQNWNALAGFLKYLPWDSTRLAVDESTVQHDQRILVWKSKQGKLGIALSNRGTKPYEFKLKGAGPLALVGHRYTVTALNVDLGKKTGDDLSITVQPQSYEFWIGR
jgi:O-glycosyl hydrolase